MTVLLPGSVEIPRAALATAALPLDARGKLTFTAGMRREAGIPGGADVLATVDAERRTVTLTAGSRLQGGRSSSFDSLADGAASAAGRRRLYRDLRRLLDGGAASAVHPVRTDRRPLPACVGLVGASQLRQAVPVPVALVRGRLGSQKDSGNASTSVAACSRSAASGRSAT